MAILPNPLLAMPYALVGAADSFQMVHFTPLKHQFSSIEIILIPRSWLIINKSVAETIKKHFML
jgi:hypothetical protein